MKPLRTNPAYAHLAYSKAVISRTIIFLQRNFLGDELTDPKEVLTCDEVFPVDSEVPQEEIQHYVEQLREEVARIEVQMSKFEFQPIEGRHEQKRAKGRKERWKKAGQGGGKGGGFN